MFFAAFCREGYLSLEYICATNRAWRPGWANCTDKGWERMVYRMKGPDEVHRESTRVNAPFAGGRSRVVEITSLPTAVMSWILDSICFSDMVNTSVEWDAAQCGVTPGDAVKAMILTMTMDAYRPALENVARRFSGQPVELMFDSVKTAGDLDPDMLARTLDKFHECDMTRLFMTVSAALRSHFGITTKAIHSDTTSVSVEGTYGFDEEDDVMYITRGYSKDLRPDLKQFMIGDAVNESGIPIVSVPLNGNTSDGKWNDECLTLLKDILSEPGIAYVADSKLITGPLVDRMIADGTRFLSRCPSNFSDLLERRVLMSVDLEKMTDIGITAENKRAASRKIAECSADHKGTKLRAIAVRSSAMDGKGDKAVEKEAVKAEGTVKEFVKEYSCRNDAEKAFARLEKKLSKSICDISAEYVHGVVESRPPGRPRADGKDIRRADRWTVKVSLEVNEEKRKALWRSEEMIVLLSNIPSKEDDPENGMTASELVKLYANEWKVEAMFKTKKTPMMVRRLYLKTPSRAEALVQTVNIAALVRAVTQLLIRRGLSDIPDDELPRYGHGMGKLQRNVTADFFTDSCGSCKIVYENGSYSFGSGTDECSRFYLDLIGIPPESLFTPGMAVRKTPRKAE